MGDLRRNLQEAIELTVESLIKDELKLKGKKAKSAIEALTKPLIISMYSATSQKASQPVLSMAKA
jgi:hypothetical protein